MKNLPNKFPDGLRPEYDLRELFRKAVRGKYAKAYRLALRLRQIRRAHI